MTRSNPSQQQMTGDPAEVNETAIDALLSEIIADSQPPDLTDQILHRLKHQQRDEPVAAPPVVGPAASVKSVVTSAASSRRDRVSLTALSMIAAVAASLLLVFALQEQDSAEQSTQVQVAETEVQPPDLIQPDHLDLREMIAGGDIIPDQRHDRSNASPTIDLTTEPPVVLAPKPAASTTASTTPTPPALARRPADSDNAPREFAAREISEVSEDIRATLVSYWENVDVQPTPDRTNDEIAQFIRRRLSIIVDPAIVSDPVALTASLRRPVLATELADQFLQQLDDNGFGQLDEPAKKKVVDAFAASFQGDVAMDRLIGGVLSGAHPASSDWYRVLASQGQVSLVDRLGQLAFNRDLRCVRCHDSFIQRTGKQADYWSFAGFVRSSLEHDQASSTWTVLPQPTRNEIFYDAVDGRRLVTKPGVPGKWLSPGSNLDALKSVSSLPDLGQRVMGTDGLAKGMVNVLWAMVHGRPLNASGVDPMSAPHDNQLDELHQKLANDLVAHRFDPARTVALILTSPVTRRSVPASLKPENQFVIDPSDANAVACFAASAPAFPRWPMARRLELIVKSSGTSLPVGSDEVTTLAQPMPEISPPAGNPKGSAAKPTAGQQWREARRAMEVRTFPTGDTEMPVAWLASLPNETSRVQHLCYLAGHSRVPDAVNQAVKTMADSDDNQNRRLSRVWWMLKP